MIQYLKNIFKRKPSQEFITEDGCPSKCHKCGDRSITMRRTLNKQKEPITKFVSCSNCKIQLGSWENDTWSY